MDEAFLEQIQHLKRFNMKEIESIMGSFDDNKVIGEGGFGKVYSGVLSDSEGEIAVALKRLSKNSGQGNPEFLKEILMLSRYIHNNLIYLVGFCDEHGEKILVYEHANNGSLDCHLSSMTLTWTQRLKICLGAARGLSYLHDPQGTQQRVIHRDIKSSNILLDENWNAKVSDMGLSKTGPANQSQSFLATNVAGTLLYIDPMYVETGILTKESDTYSFGVVLFEVMCGTLCFKQRNDRFQSLVPRWKKSYRDNKLDEIIFPHLKQDMNTRSREIFSEIAYQCLLRSRSKRPKMSHVVEKLELALQFQQGISNPEEFKELVKLSVVNEEEHEMLLYKGIIFNEGNTWFSVNEKGEHCEMISAECFIPTSTEHPNDYVPYDDEIKSRFEVCNRRDLYVKFNAHMRTQFLSPNITYKVNLVFMSERKRVDHLGIQYKSPSETNYSILFVAHEREDGWLMANLYQFMNDDTSNVDLKIEFDCTDGIEVEGIEFMPLEEDEFLLENEDQDQDQDQDHDEDEDEDTYWERKLPSDYKKIILWGEESLQQATKKELYSIFCKGFPFYFSGEQWISLAKNGEKCHMLSARLALGGPNCIWAWQSLPESRFGEVAIDPVGAFWIYCNSDYLSRETTYATYLVYKLQENHSWFEPPVVCKRVFYGFPEQDPCPWVIYLLSPETSVIKGKFYQKKGLPQQRNDGWMEVQVYEFETDTQRISIEFELKLFDFESLKGLIVQGIEFKPI